MNNESMHWLEQLLEISPFDWASIGTAVFCGTAIGLERQLRGKPVGIRTSSLIVLGTYLFLATAFNLQSDLVDPSRVIGQVITGVGFLGAGVMLTKKGSVIGVTSASAIWALAALGTLVAAGHLTPAIKLTLLIVLILYGVDLLEEHFFNLTKGVHARVKKRFSPDKFPD
jgi:putative Mg2+ transporter-C (MgtC) family protein